MTVASKRVFAGAVAITMAGLLGASVAARQTPPQNAAETGP
jgi:hypothetical protein